MICWSRAEYAIYSHTIFQYYGLTAKQMQALTETLKINVHVNKLILQDNWLSKDVTEMLSNMLEENTCISVLNIKECRIGDEGILCYCYHNRK